MKQLSLIREEHRVLVFGGREYEDEKHVHDVLNRLYAIEVPNADTPFLKRPSVIVHGAARGVDSFAGNWERANNVREWTFPVSELEWRRFGWRAGHRRNQQMLDESQPHLALGFPGASGTADMTERVQRRGVMLVEVGWMRSPWRPW